MNRFLFLTLLFSFTTHLSAQICDGVGGAISYLEDFGAGPNPGPELPAGSTTYNFGLGGGGLYYVTNDSGQNGALWHSAEDHTPNDVDGYMLLFDAAAAVGTFFQITLDELCPNTRYAFYCYVANIVVPSACGSNSIEPDLRFTISNPATTEVLESVTSGSIPVTNQLEWIEVGVIFRTRPGQTTALVQVTNNAPGGCGNDLVIDDFTLNFCNPITDQTFDLCEIPGGSVTVGGNTYTQPGNYQDLLLINDSCNDSLVFTTLTGENVLLPSIRYAFCEGESVIINDQEYTSTTTFIDTIYNGTPCPDLQTYEIVSQPAQTITQSLFLCFGEEITVGGNIYTEAGTYIDSLFSEIGCDSIVITELQTAGIEVSLSETKLSLELGESVLLTTSTILSTEPAYSWLPANAFSCSDCSNPVFQPLSTGNYSLVATDVPSGCTDTLLFTVNVLPCSSLYIPNAFSPNRDGVNDQFQIFAKPCYRRILSLHIFNRWGGLIHEATDLSLATDNTIWDGRVDGERAELGVYVYQFSVELIDGSTQLVTGDVLLLP